MNPTIAEIERFLLEVADEVGTHRLREFCDNFAAFPVSLDRPEDQSSEMQDIFKTMLDYRTPAELRAILRMLAETGEHFATFLLE
jgi:hypothetical protein